jgi:hypothetical protein
VFLRAGLALERANKVKEAVALYEEYVHRCPGAAGKRGVEALTRAGVLVRPRDPAAAAALFARAHDLFAKAKLQPGGPQAAFAAQARFLQGEARFADFEQVKLELPEKEMQKRIGEKAKRMKTAVDTYLQVARLKAPDWTAAAAYKIGLCYQRFAEALVEAPVPQNMSDDEKEIYRAGLQERAQRIEDQAQKAFETAVRFARAARAYNEWTALSAEHLAAYRTADFPATEVKLATDRPHQATLETGGVR